MCRSTRATAAAAAGGDDDDDVQIAGLPLTARTTSSHPFPSSPAALRHIIHFLNVLRPLTATGLENMTSSAKPEVHNVSQRCQEDDRATATGNVRTQQLSRAVFETCERTDILAQYSLQYFALLS